jgi:hypothetical protein
MSTTLVFAVRILEGMFLVGSVGCFVVLVLTAIEDVKTLFGRDHDAPLTPQDEMSPGTRLRSDSIAGGAARP